MEASIIGDDDDLISRLISGDEDEHLYQEYDLNEIITRSLKTLKQPERDPSKNLHLYRALDRFIKKYFYDAALDYTLLDQLLIYGLTHVWSAIRTCATSLVSQLVIAFEPEKMESFYHKLVDIHLQSTSWQHRHGAISAILAIVRSMHPKDAGSGLTSEPGLAHYLDKGLIDIVFTLLSDDQVSIRHVAVKTWAAFVARTGPTLGRQHCISSLRRALALLDCPDQSSFHCREGVLELIQEIVSHLSYKELMILWPKYHHKLEMHLGHEACTIRQLCSKIYLSLISGHRSDQDPYYQSVFISYIIQSLTCRWHDVRSGPTPTESDRFQAVYTSSSNIPPAPASDSDDGMVTVKSWHLAEGILMTQELIIKYLKSRLSARIRHDHHRPSLTPYSGQIPSEQKPCCHQEQRLRSQSVSGLQSSQSDGCRLLVMLLSLELDKNLLWTQQTYDRIPERQCHQCGQSVFYVDQDVTRLSTILSCWLSEAIESGLSRRWELRRMSDQVLESLFEFLNCFWSSMLVEFIRGPHHDDVERIRACLSARYLVKYAQKNLRPYPAPDASCFASWITKPNLDQVPVLSLVVLWDLMAIDPSTLERHLPDVLNRTLNIASDTSNTIRHWFCNAIQEPLIRLAKSGHISNPNRFIVVLLGLIRSVSNSYRCGLMQALFQINIAGIGDDLCRDIANCCIAILSDSPAEDLGFLALSTLEMIVISHSNSAMIEDVLSKFLHRHGSPVKILNLQDDGLLVTPSSGHIKQLSLDSDSGRSSSSAGSLELQIKSGHTGADQQVPHDFDSDTSDTELDFDLERRISALLHKVTSARFGQLAGSL